MVDIHKTAIIEEGAIIEDGVTIGPYCVVGKDVIIKKGTVLQSHVVVEGITEIGENNTIYSFVSIGKANQDLKYVHVAHDVIIGDDCILANNVTLAGHVVVDSHAIIGGLTPIHQFTRIGSYSMIGGASGVNQDICPFVLAEGNKAVIRGLNSVGLRRRGFSDDEISNLKKAYRILFRQGLQLKDALEELEKDFSEDKNVKYLVDFIKSSDRGIAR